MENRTLDAGGSAGESGTHRLITWLQNRRLMWIPALAVLLVVALIIGLTFAFNSSNDEEPTDDVSRSESPVLKPSEEPDETLDSDGDGIPDVVELAGWKTAGGEIYRTDPNEADTDSDGLSDSEEAGELISGKGLDAVYAGFTNPTEADSDGDGLDDGVEALGWMTKRNESFTTDPMNPDSDGDGLADGIEAGEPSENDVREILYSGFSNPLMKDSDGDEISDLEEADALTNPYSKDSDGDGLSDFDEVRLTGTDPNAKDTDGDGLNDSFEERNRSLRSSDPLFHDEKVTRWNYAADFFKGAVVGDFSSADSVAWLVGNISITAFGFIPALGWSVSAGSDLRDLVAALIRRDWVSAAFSLAGVVPYGGDAAALTRKVTKFVEKNPTLVAKVGGVIMKQKHLPEEVKTQLSKSIWKKWGSLIQHGATQNALLVLQHSGRMDLDEIADTLERAGHIIDEATPLMDDAGSGEKYLERRLRDSSEDVQVRQVISLERCSKCESSIRMLDVIADGVAHEAKTGYTVMTPSVESQIHSDASLMKNAEVESVRWHFYTSSRTNQLGASKEVLDMLEKNGIHYTIHLPRTE